MDPLLSASRVSRLKKRFQDVLSGSVKLDSRGATLFLEGLCAQGDPVACLGAITKSTRGLSLVQSAMRFDLSVKFMNGTGSTVLQSLLKASDVGGNALDNLLFHLVEPPVFWDAFVRAFQQGTLSEDAQLVFAKLLARLLALQNRDNTPYRSIAAQPFIQDGLLASSKYEIREIGHLIRHILSDDGLVKVSHNWHDGPGGRHDNDFADYRHITILPTADEIQCRKPPFLRAAFHDELSTESEDPFGDYLDNTFRMLREDMLFDVREEVEKAFQKKGHQRSPHVSMAGIYVGTDDRRSRWGIKLQCRTDFRQLRNITEQEDRLAFLTRDPRGLKIMKHQSFVCLVSGQEIISFGTVNRVEVLLACIPPVIVLQLDGAANISKTVTALCANKSVQVIPIDAATFSFEPVLTALQKMKNVPLTSEILHLKQETANGTSRKKKALSHIANMLTSNFSVDLKTLLDLPASICLDKSQAKSLVTGLTTRVSLIQGPPGTGKSFIGTILAKAIHDKTSQTILIVCYTNHALDQFLGDLLKYDIPAESMVRLGGRSNQSVEHLSLRNQPRGRVQYNWDKINELEAETSIHRHKLQSQFGGLGQGLDAMLINYLKQEHKDFFDAFRVPSATDDGMTFVGENGRAIDNTYIFSRWMRGLNAGVLSGEPHVRAAARIWSMGHSARQQLLAKWRHKHATKAAESISQAGVKYNKSYDAVRQEFGESTAAVLRDKRIIACTTTGAAIYADAIKAAGPEFLLVEEAGEILEAHTLTALSHKVNQMILIGDHKQLRPKVNNYQLTVERGEGFDLNRSLFERLVVQGYPHETLSTQHRMRPEISAFVRELTYPELIDAPSTHQRPHIRGVQSNIIFVDHTYPEDDNALIADRTDGGAKSSKQNTYEVQMVLKIVCYLAQQGYKSGDIVVLTPYLGQLHQLRDALKGDNDLVLNDLDFEDLVRAGLSDGSGPPGHRAGKGSIRLATIDNYQGEESDIVVASLTRSNPTNVIGFMDSPERLNVLLSRARNGLILIGNAHTFLHSKKGGALWRRFFNLLESGRYVYAGFPVRCERHPERVGLLARAADFDLHCPDGGCTEPCGFTLACGHVCPMKCHPRRSSSTDMPRDPHDTAQCRHTMRAKCRAGHHTLEWQCRFGRPAGCATCNEEAKRLAEVARRAIEQQRARAEAELEHRRRMVALEMELRIGEATRVKEEQLLQEDQRAQELVWQEESKKRQEEGERIKQEEEEKKRREKEAKKKKKEEKRKRKEEKKKRKEEKKRQEENKTKDLEAKLRAEGVARAEDGCRLQGLPSAQQGNRVGQEECGKLQESSMGQDEEHRKREEVKKQEVEKRRQERKMRREERKMKKQEEMQKKESKAKRGDDETKWFQEGVLQKQTEERRERQCTETNGVGTQAQQSGWKSDAPVEGVEMYRLEASGERHGQINLLHEATRRRVRTTLGRTLGKRFEGRE